MNTNKLLKIALIIAILTIAGSILYRYVVYLPQRFIPKEEKSQQDILEETVLERFNSYSDMISVQLCKEAYDEFITKGSMERKGYDNFLAHCKYRGTSWGNIQVQNIVFSSETRVDIKYTYNRESIISPLFLSGKPSKIEAETIYDSSIETWLLEDSKWKRDY